MNLMSRQSLIYIKDLSGQKGRTISKFFQSHLFDFCRRPCLPFKHISMNASALPPFATYCWWCHVS